MNNSVFKNIWSKAKKYLYWFYKSYIWIFILLFLFDIITKHVFLSIYGGWDNVLNNFYPKDITFIPGFISFTFTLNPGAGFGMLGNVDNEVLRRTLLIGISVIMTGIFVLYYGLRFKKLNGVYKGILMALTAGAFGNLIDRAFYPNGYVIDFIKFDFMDFPVFNIADSVLVISIIVLIIYMIYDTIKNSKKDSEVKDENPLRLEVMQLVQISDEKDLQLIKEIIRAIHRNRFYK